MQNILPSLLPPYLSLACDTVILERSLKTRAQELLTSIGFTEKSLLLVCDAKTHAALGARLQEELPQAKLLLLKEHARADESIVEHIRSHEAEAIIAVGSGTINDVCKYASYLSGIPYAVFPTAASMNGYLSTYASLTIHDHKQSLKAHLPRGVFCDLEVIANAPKRLTLSGLGDSLCRSTAQIDWLLSHLLLGTTYDPMPFELLKPFEEKLFASDSLNIDVLMKTLLLSGIGMTLASGSYPASQGEHLIAHTMEMKHGSALPETYHGEQIGVTTLTMARLQEKLLHGTPHFSVPENWEHQIESYFSAEAVPSIKEAYRLKLDRLSREAASFSLRWKEVSEFLQKLAIPADQLKQVLQRAGAPFSAQQLGWSETDYEQSVCHARFIRDRFTFLDLL